MGGDTSRKIKNIKLIKFEHDREIPESRPYKLCTFSRVMREKGLEDANASVEAANQKYGRIGFKIDIYGQSDEGYKERFSAMQHYIHYKELVPFNQSVETIKNYFALLFPTYSHGEGFAGTLIEQVRL